jgi:hypothetical protein
MGQPSFSDNVREWIGHIAWRVFLWSIRMTEEQYHETYLDDLRREYLSEKNSAWFTK